MVVDHIEPDVVRVCMAGSMGYHCKDLGPPPPSIVLDLEKEESAPCRVNEVQPSRVEQLLVGLRNAQRELVHALRD